MPILETFKGRLIALLAGAAVLVLGGSFLASNLQKASLESCFKDSQIEYTVENRAAEAAKRGIWGWTDSKDQQEALAGVMCPEGLGFTVVTDYQKALSAPMTAAQSFVPVTSMTLRDGQTLSMATLGSVVFLTLEPGATNEEIVACTDLNTVTKQFTGCTRGLAFSGTSTAAVAANAKTHSSGSTIVMSNVHYVYQQFLDKNGDIQYVTSTVIFNNLPRASSTTAVPTLPQELATMFYVDQQVAGGFSCASASSTLGITCAGTPAVFGINLNATSSGLYFSGTNASQLTVQTSSTGGITVNGSGRVILDTSDAQTWTGAWTLNNQVTVNAGVGALYVPTPTDVANPVPLNYAQVLVALGQATGTAQVAVTAGQSLWMSATSSQIMVTNSNIASSTFQFIGIAASTTSAGQTVTYTKPGGINCNQSGLTPGIGYFINGTSGQISTTAGTFFAKVGLALSSTCIQVQFPKFLVRGIVENRNSTAAFFVNTGFYPAHISINATAAASPAGYSIGDDTNNCAYYISNVFTQVVDGTCAYRVSNSAPSLIGQGTVTSKSVFGFTVTPSVSANATTTLQYAAWSE